MIYTFGGQGELVQSIFNAIARMFASDSDYFTAVGKFSMSLGAVWAATYAIFQGNIGIFAKQWFFPSFLIFIFLFSPKAAVIINDDINRKQYAVANVPFAIALFSSLSSRISYFIAQDIEKHFGIAARARSSHNGLMFGARLVSKFRDIKVQNPILLDNAKNFTKQCYIRPWIMGNILGMRHEAETTKDIIKFLRENQAKNFGVYYKSTAVDKENQETKETIEFRTCSDITSTILNAIEKEAKSGKVLGKLGLSLGGKGIKLDVLAKRVTETGNAALKTLARETQSVHQWVRQSMMLNVYRESLDDWREGAGYQRLWPEVISMNATRGLYQQSLGWMTAGEMAAQFLPLLQTILFLIVVSSIFIVFPMSMLPGGYEILKVWVKAMIWVNTWPIFFAVINCIGMNILAYKGVALGNDFGLDKTTQGEFSDMLIHTYAMVQMFAAMVPILSWMLLSKSGHAFSSMTERLSPMATGAALGASTVDNTLNLDNINIGNRQMAQQNVGPNLNMGSSVDTGAMRVTQGDNKTFLDERASNLATNYRGSSTEMKSLSDSYAKHQTHLDSLNLKDSKLTSTSETQMQNFAENWLQSDDANAIENTSLANSMRVVKAHGLNTSETFTDDRSKDVVTSSNAGGNLSGQAGVGGSAKGVRVGASAGVNVGVSAGANNRKSVAHSNAAQTTESYQKSLEDVQNYITSNETRKGSSNTTQLSNSINNTKQEQQSISSERADTMQNMEALESRMAYVRQNQTAVDQNWNDKVLTEAADRHGLTSKQEALSHLHSHPAEGATILRSLVTDNMPSMPKTIDSTPSINYKQEKARLEEGHNKRTESNVAAQQLQQQVAQKINKSIKNDVERIPGNAKTAVEDKFERQESKFNSVSNSTVKRTGIEVWDNAKGVWSNDTSSDEKE